MCESEVAQSLSRVRLLATPWTAAYQAPLSMGFSRQEYWSGVPVPSPKVRLPKNCSLGCSSWFSPSPALREASCYVVSYPRKLTWQGMEGGLWWKPVRNWGLNLTNWGNWILLTTMCVILEVDPSPSILQIRLRPNQHLDCNIRTLSQRHPSELHSDS